MTVRSKTFGGTTVHAGPAPELAALALEYAQGLHGRFTDDQCARFRACAEDLKNGVIGTSNDRVRFWPDAADGRPFQGPIAYRPDPDPEWAAAEARRTARRR